MTESPTVGSEGVNDIEELLNATPSTSSALEISVIGEVTVKTNKITVRKVQLYCRIWWCTKPYHLNLAAVRQSLNPSWQIQDMPSYTLFWSN